MTKHTEEARKWLSARWCVQHPNEAHVRQLAEYAEYAFAAAEERGRPQWRLIDTAPRSNGSIPFLAFIPGHGQCVCACTVLGNVYSISSNRTVHKATHWTHLPSDPHVTKEQTP